MRLCNSAVAESIMNRAGVPDDTPLESKMVSRAIQSAQTQVEARNFEIRKNVLEYDDVLSRQRTVIYDERRRRSEERRVGKECGAGVPRVSAEKSIAERGQE